MKTPTVLVCQNRTCRKQGAKQVLAALNSYILPDVKIIGSGCLGQCGNGPMVLILRSSTKLSLLKDKYLEPEKTWYARVDNQAKLLKIKRDLLRFN